MCLSSLIPESARWLLAMGRKEESVQILKKAAKVNGVLLSEETLESLEVRNLHYSLLRIITHPSYQYNIVGMRLLQSLAYNHTV